MEICEKCNKEKREIVGVISPPFLEQNSPEAGGGDRLIRPSKEGSLYKVGDGTQSIKYSSNPSNIGNLPDKKLAGITSPPYENQLDRYKLPEKFLRNAELKHNRSYFYASFKEEKYSEPKSENLGNQQGQSYLSEMLLVYSEAYKSGISPLCTVTKNPTRQGKLRRLDLDTAKLLEMAGYKIIDFHKSILFEEKTQQTLFGDVKKIAKGRISFFKRLSLQKGNVAANYEDVLIAVIPTLQK